MKCKHKNIIPEPFSCLIRCQDCNAWRGASVGQEWVEKLGQLVYMVRATKYERWKPQ